MDTPTNVARWKKLLRPVVSIAIGVALFLVLDWDHSARIERSVAGSDWTFCCMTKDALRVYALKPNCSCVRAWGDKRYPFITNSLGFRDEEIREITPTSAKPRILLLGDSFTEGKVPWKESYAGRIAANFPQYDVLNGSMGGTSPSNYLNTARIMLNEGVDGDEVIVFIDISDAQDEAGLFHDVDASGAVALADRHYFYRTWYSNLRLWISQNLLFTNTIVEFFEKMVVRFGCYHLDHGTSGNEFDRERSAWTYRKVSDSERFETGYAPLGLEGGIAKEKAKMDLLWRELQQRNIPLSVVVYPWPAQLVHDTVDSRQVRIWRDWCEGKCKRFISVFPAFFAGKAQCPQIAPGCWYSKYFIFGDIHYNSGGNALVADAVSESLSATPVVKHQPSIPGSDSVNQTHGAAPKSEHVDGHG